MAQKVEILLLDDLDGSDAVETISFGLDGNGYEIDLNETHAKELREALASYIGKGRKTQARRGRRPAGMNAEAAAAAANGSKTTGKRGGGRKRTATIEEVEASKTADSKDS